MRSIVTDGLKQNWSGPPESHGWTQTELVESNMTLLLHTTHTTEKTNDTLRITF
jgi:hypothetical protein